MSGSTVGSCSMFLDGELTIALGSLGSLDFAIESQLLKLSFLKDKIKDKMTALTDFFFIFCNEISEDKSKDS